MVVHFQIYLAASDLSIVRCLGHCFSATGAGNEGRASFGALRSSKLKLLYLHHGRYSLKPQKEQTPSSHCLEIMDAPIAISPKL
ncbi:unnamed protein product, partial [Vitis vinifera]|uniref:Uncharacterized protein n=1 Tax=Vitis vinifera TaxID=29760 RepID=D7TP24_VITVI